MPRKKKNNKRQNTKTKVEFVRSICNKSCKLCDVDREEVSGLLTADLFCYDFLYAYDPQTFLSKILPKTQKVGFWAHNVEEEVPTIDEINEFQDIFCKEGVCNTADFSDGVCTNVEFCVGLFRDYVVSDCGVNEDDTATEQNDNEFFAKSWDGTGAAWERKPKKEKCKKRGKNKANKKLSKKDRRRAKNKNKKETNNTTWEDPTPRVTTFTNMNEAQLKFIYGEDENNDKEQTEAKTSTG